jgi:hypothetical protein
VPKASVESIGAKFDLNFMIALVVFFWMEIEEERRPY